MDELDSYINKVKKLPPMPPMVPQLMTLLNDPDVDSEKVVKLITYDPSLTANVLQACNSALFSGSAPADDVGEAIMRIGFQQVYRMVVLVSSSRMLKPSQTGYGIDEGELWKHSVATAVAAQTLAKELGDNESTAFTAALLHDIGKIILSQALEHIYKKLVEETEAQQAALVETEKRLLGVTHAEVGGRLLTRWKFPPNLVTAVTFHHEPGSAPEHQRVAACVYLGNLIAYSLGHGYGHLAFAQRGRADALDLLGVNGDDIPRLMIRAQENFAAVQSLLQL
ncbi:MAG: HDOD domain-containing protein [Verrucomicrobia bacterium]|nr:HDOD domain-containing protein [Verrucomicrobiota bacterium]